MNFTKEQIKVAKYAINTVKNSSLKILNNVFIKDNYFMINNIDEQFKIKIDHKFNNEFILPVPIFKKMLDCKKWEILEETKEEIKIKINNIETRIFVDNDGVKEFPQPEHEPKFTECNGYLTEDVLKKLQKRAFFLSKDENRKALNNYVFLENNFYGTDGHIAFKFSNYDLSETMQFKPNIIKILSKLVYVFQNDTYLMYENTDIEIMTKKPPNKYPDIKCFFSDLSKSTNFIQLNEQWKDIKDLETPQINELIRFEKQYAMSRNLEKTITNKLECIFHSNLEFTIGFNKTYLYKLLSLSESKTLKIVDTNIKATYIDDDKEVFLIMPLRILD